MAALKGVKTLDMKNGEITKVSYEGSEYERVEGVAKVGDLVRLSDDARHDVTPGGFYTVRGVRVARVQITDDVNDPHHWDEEYYDLFRKKHTRLKVGDYAKVVDSSEYTRVAEGAIVRITKDDGSRCPFYCDILSGEREGDSGWMEYHVLVPATEDEVAAAKEAEAKRSIEAKWAKIGRKVDEYKVGDIVAYNELAGFGNEGLGKVIEDSTCNSFPKIGAIDGCGDLEEYYVPRLSLTLITPVEARFDRS